MPYIQVDSKFYMYYQSLGNPNDKPVLLLHGLGATGESWGLQSPALIQAGYRVIIIDLRGFGKSNHAITMSIPQLAKDCAVLLNKLQANPADLVGISMGGIVALQLAISHPSMVDRLVIINAFARLRPKKAAFYGYYLIRFILVNIFGMRFQARTVAKRIFPYPKQAFLRQVLVNQILESNPWAYRRAMIDLARFNVVNQLDKIQAPTLVVTGENDTTVLPADQAYMASKIQNHRHIIVPNAGHAATIDSPDVVNQHILEFLATQVTHL